VFDDHLARATRRPKYQGLTTGEALVTALFDLALGDPDPKIRLQASEIVLRYNLAKPPQEIRVDSEARAVIVPWLPHPSPAQAALGPGEDAAATNGSQEVRVLDYGYGGYAVPADPVEDDPGPDDDSV
jgi:hypothetical protein